MEASKLKHDFAMLVACLFVITSGVISTVDGARRHSAPKEEDYNFYGDGSGITKEDCQDFVHRIFNMSVVPHRNYSVMFSVCERMNTTISCTAPPVNWFDERRTHTVNLDHVCDGRYDCAAMDAMGEGNDEKGCYVFEYGNFRIFIITAICFVAFLLPFSVGLVHMERLIFGGGASLFSGFDGREFAVAVNGEDAESGDDGLGEWSTKKRQDTSGPPTHMEIKKFTKFFGLLSQSSTSVYGELHASYRQLRDCPNYASFLAKSVSMVGLAGPETALTRLYWLERSCQEFGSRVDARLHFIKHLQEDRTILGVIDGEIERLPENGDKMYKGGPDSFLRNYVFYNYPRLVSLFAHGFVFGTEMFNYYIDLFRDTLIVLGIFFMSEIRMRPDVKSDVGDMILTLGFLSLAPFIVNMFAVALSKGMKWGTKIVMTCAFFLRPGMTYYRLFRTSMSVDHHRLRLRNLLLNERPADEVLAQLAVIDRAETELRVWKTLSDKMFIIQLYLEHMPSVIILFQIGFGGTYLWTEVMGNIQTQILVMQLFESPPYFLSVILALTAFGVVVGQWRSAHFQRETVTGLPARLAYAAFLIIGNLGSYLALYAAMVLGLIYGMVESTYFMNLIVLYALLAAKFSVIFAVTWAISTTFRNKTAVREKAYKCLAQVLCPNIFEDFERDMSQEAWRRLGAQYLAVHGVHLAFNFLVVYANNVFHHVPFPMPGGYATLFGLCAAVSALQLVPAYVYYRLLHPRRAILKRELFGGTEAPTLEGGSDDHDKTETFHEFQKVWQNAPYTGVTVK